MERSQILFDERSEMSHKRSINKGHKKILGIEDERFGLLQQQI